MTRLRIIDWFDYTINRPGGKTVFMENFNLLLPDTFGDFEKHPENLYAVKGIGKNYSRQDFKDFTEQFTKNISKDPSSIMEADFYEPAFYLMKNHTRDPAFGKILEKVVLTIGANFHKVLNSIPETIMLDDENVQCFLRFMVILLGFLDKAIANKNEEDILDEEGEIKKRKRRENEGHNLVDLVKNIVLKFRELCYGVVFRELLKKCPGLGRLLYKEVKQVMKDSVASYDERANDDSHTCLHIFQIIEELIELEILKTYTLQYDMAMLVNDVEIAHKTVGGFILNCSRSKKAKIYELASSTIIFIIKKHCMTKSKTASESNSVRYFRQFFEYLAPELADIFHNHLQDCLFLYDSQCHPLRNALTEIIKQIIINKCGTFEDNSKDEELGSNNEGLRKELLEWIIQRTRDKSSWCRFKAIGDLHDLMILRMISNESIGKIFEKAALHIRDPTSNVRKKAMMLASEIITYYIVNMKFPEEETIPQELEEIKARRAESERQAAENPDDRELLAEQILVAMKYEKLLLFYHRTYQILAGLLPQVVSLMFRSSNDSLEAIRLLVKMKNLGYNKVDTHFPKMYTLIWSEDQNITSEIKASFINLYVNKERKQNACKNICNLLKMCDRSTKVCVLRVIKVLFEDSYKNRALDQKSKNKYVLEEDFIPLFWTFFQEKFENARNASDEEDYRFALKIIGEGLVYYPKWFYTIKRQDIIYLMKLYITRQRRVVDWEVLTDICKIISRTGKRGIDSKTGKEKEGFDNEDTHHLLILRSLEEIITLHQGVAELGWYGTAQSYIQAVFDVSKCPEIQIEIFIKRMSGFLNSSHEIPYEAKVIKLNQLIWTSGEVALKLLIRIEDVEELLKKRRVNETANNQANKPIEEPEELDQAMGGFDSVYQNQRKVVLY